MSVTFTPSKLNTDGSRERPETGSVIDNEFIDKPSLVSTDADNLLKVGTDGALEVLKSDLPAGGGVDPADLVSSQAGNQISVAADNKLFVPEVEVPTASDLVSSQAGNQITVSSTDAKLYAAATDPNSLVSGVTGNAISVAADGKLFVATADTPTPADLISADANNQLTVGTDSKLYVTGVDQPTAADLRSTDADNLLRLGTDTKMTLTSRSMISDTPALNLLTVNASDKGLQLLPSDVQNAIAVVSTDHGNALVKGSDGGAFLDSASVDVQLTAGEGIAVDGSKISVSYGKGLDVNSTTNKLYVNTDDLDIQKISLLATEKILTLNDMGILTATASLSYNANDSTLSLYGVNSNLLSTVTLPGATSALQAVELVENPVGYEPGSYFKYTFVTAAGTLSYVYVKVPTTSSIQAGDGIHAVEASGVTTVSVQPRANSGLEVDSTGVAVKLKTDGGLSMDSNGLFVDKQPADIEAGSGIDVTTAGTTTTIAAKIKTDGGLAVDDNGLYVTAKAAELTEGQGINLTVTGTSTEVAAKLKADGGLGVDANGLYADTQVVASKDSVDNIVDGTTGVTLKTLQEAIEAGAIGVSGVQVDPSTMDPGTATLEPATDLLGG